jgi:transposase-like protein
MMAERDVIVSHTTIMRWVLRYVPEYERRWARFAQPPGSSLADFNEEREWVGFCIGRVG